MRWVRICEQKVAVLVVGVYVSRVSPCRPSNRSLLSAGPCADSESWVLVCGPKPPCRILSAALIGGHKKNRTRVVYTLQVRSADSRGMIRMAYTTTLRDRGCLIVQGAWHHGHRTSRRGAVTVEACSSLRSLEGWFPFSLR